MIHGFFLSGSVSAGGDVSVHGTAAGSSWSVEPAGTQPVCSGHHGRGMGKRKIISLFIGTVEKQSKAINK